MKTKMIAIMAALALVSPAFAESECDKHDRDQLDYTRFEKWLEEVYEIAPSWGLKLHPGAEDEVEFFYLHCWQSDDQSAANCVRKAKEIWGTKSK